MSTANNYDIGDVVRLSATFRTTAGALADPTKVTFKYQDPSGNTVTVTSTAAGVIHPSSGLYYTDISPDETGVWEYRIYSTGSVASSTEDWFRVRTQRVP